jgi:hypothetical protein
VFSRSLIAATMGGELQRMQVPTAAEDMSGAPIRNLTGLLWASIDNDDSRDLDQLTVADTPARDAATIRIAVADVDALVKNSSAIDEHARQHDIGVHGGCGVPMLRRPGQIAGRLSVRAISRTRWPPAHAWEISGVQGRFPRRRQSRTLVPWCCRYFARFRPGILLAPYAR